MALGGTDANSAIEGFNPGQSADTLYVTNGETTDYAESAAGTIAYTPELGEGEPGSGFVFPDDEALIQAEFQRLLSFHLGLARSAANPANPVSPVGIDVEPFYLDQDDIDPQNGQQSLFDFKFAVSYGDPQEVRVLAKRSLGPVTLNFQVGDGAVQQAPTSEWNGGGTYGPGNGTYYHVVSGEVTGTDTGDSVKVWFTGGGETSDSFTYTVESNTDRRVLILSAEDYTGASPVKPGVTSPQYLSFYADALAANGVEFDVYDVDAHGRTAPDNLGVLSHYDAVLWYTGDDVVTREPGWGPGNASRLAMQELLEVRDFVNEGGRVLYTGKAAGQQYTPGLGAQLYDPFENKQCRADPAIQARCLALLGSGNSQGDPIEYMFGAAITTVDGGLDPDTGDPFPIDGIDDPLSGLSWTLNGADSAQNQTTDSSFIATGDFLKVTDPDRSFPQFESWPAAEYRSGLAGPFDPHTGSSFMWSDRADEAYKRLSRTITVPAGGATPVLLDELQPRAGLRLPDRRGPHRRPGRLDDAARPERAHLERPEHGRVVHGRLEQPGRCGERPAPVPDALPDVRPGDRQLQLDRLERRLERRQRQLERLAAVRDRPRGVRELPGRGLDHRPERLGTAAVPRRLHRRRRGLDRRGHHLVRGRRRPDGRLDGPRRPPGRAGHRGPQPQRLDPARRPRDQGRGGGCNPAHRLPGSGLRGHQRRRNPEPDHEPGPGSPAAVAHGDYRPTPGPLPRAGSPRRVREDPVHQQRRTAG